ncbi:Nitrogen regulatory protein P-II [Actibacterium lipolyticum]|uniref:Nitrogen regulatory protein P-II n=1 Tax=Actibacterium lipolyticum TaxID=1524263 RepID=A0A238JJ87_9RHOB|nr:Nitrogen regulatory protein P-II [Actibacterium lipolyticum]
MWSANPAVKEGFYCAYILIKRIDLCKNCAACHVLCHLRVVAFLESAARTRPCDRREYPRRESAQRKGNDVKLIIAAIKPFKLEEVREALTAIGVRGMMVTEIKGFGSQSGHTEIYRGAEYAVNFVPKVKLEIVVSAAMADQVVETIATTAKTDKIGDGKIFVLDVNQAVRVRTGETNDDAL